jgi:hypothetical protein
MAAVELALIGEELNVNDMKALELTEQPGGGVRDRTHRIVWVGLHPVIKFDMGVQESQVVHVAIAVVQGISTKK